MKLLLGAITLIAIYFVLMVLAMGFSRLGMEPETSYTLSILIIGGVMWHIANLENKASKKE